LRQDSNPILRLNKTAKAKASSMLLSDMNYPCLGLLLRSEIGEGGCWGMYSVPSSDLRGLTVSVFNVILAERQQ
jgi:hypothetical protein